MTSYAYDPDAYLVSAGRSIHDYVRDQLLARADIGDVVDVEMSYPDTRDWTKDSPLERSLVHFELDDDPAMILGFGVPQTLDDQGDDTAIVSEPQVHHLNYDVGIWTSPQSGGTTKRAQLRQALRDIFGTATGRVAFNEATEGLQAIEFGGGSDVLDRVNSLPIYRTTGITLVVSVFSRLTQSTPVDLVTDAVQLQHLSIDGADGTLEHVSTDEDPWT